ncbi:MAG: DNA N-6-adenine-methyltransferase [Christensenellales bacterium]
MQKNNCLFSSVSVEWATPQALFDELDAEFHFDLDPCCTHENAKCAEHFTKAEDGLSQIRVKGVLQSALRERVAEVDQKAHDEAEKARLW